MAIRKLSDPIKSTARQSKAQRRAGEGASCAECGETRPQAIVPRSRPRSCEECYRRRCGMKATDSHHIAGKSNSPITIEVPANTHRAALSVAQHEWPTTTLENRDGSPVIRAAAALRGAGDVLVELIVGLLEMCATLLEALDRWLRDTLGERWWIGTAFEGWQPQ